MKIFIKCGVLLALSMTLSWSASSFAAAEEESVANVQRMIEAIDQDVVELNLLTEQEAVDLLSHLESLR